MKMHAYIGILLTLFLTLALLPVLPAATASDVMVEVIFENGSNEITTVPCDNFVASIKVTLPAGVVIDFWSMEIHWDPAVLELQTGTAADVVEGPFMKAFGTTIFLVLDPDNAAGILPEIACAFLVAVKASGTGILCDIKFHCKSFGDGNIIIFDPYPPGDETYLIDGLNPVPIDVVINGVVHQPPPPAVRPNAEFTPASSTIVYVCDDVTLDATASLPGWDTLPEPGQLCPITEYKWEIDKGGDGTVDLTLYGMVTVFHCDEPGDVYITLTVLAPDPIPPTHPDYQEYDSETHIIHQIQWCPRSPDAAFTPEDCTTIFVCDDVTLDATASLPGWDSLPECHECPIVGYTWEIDFDCDGTIDLVLEGGYIPDAFHCDEPGDVSIKLTVWAPDPLPPTHLDYVEYDSETHIIHQKERRTQEEAIEAGTAWLADQQNDDGSWGQWYQVAKTGFAVLKFETHAIRQFIDPLDPSYEYYDQVRGGLDYIFLTASTISIGMQPAGDPDTDGDGTGVHWYDLTYFTGIAMMAIAASTHPEMMVNVAGSAVNGWTYKEVVQDAVDYFAWGQTDIGGSSRGGWWYDSMDNEWWGADNSNTGYAVLGLAYAEAPSPYGFGLAIPAFVKSELNIWIDYIQNDVDGDSDGGSGYTDPWGWVNILKTGNLLFEMAFVGDTKQTTRVKDAVDYIERHWNDANDEPGWRGYLGGIASYQAMYTTMKGFEALGIDTIIVDSTEVDWEEEFCEVLVTQQNPDGSWPPCIWADDPILATEWALLTKQKVVVIPGISVYVDIKPGSFPNPLNLKSQGLIPVAICGTADFDVTTIDPQTIRLTREGVEDGVAPIRWSYEDVATPYTGEPCGGHELGGDGYLDLTLKFKTQELVATLGLNAFKGEVIVLILTGNLKEEHGGTPIRGQDCVWILNVDCRDLVHIEKLTAHMLRYEAYMQSF